MFHPFNQWKRKAGRKHKRGPCGKLRDVRRSLREWYGYGVGEAVAEEERAQLGEALTTLFGYHLVQLGHINDCEHLSSSYIRHQVVLDLDLEHTDLKTQCYSEPGDLPIATDSVDVVILPHVLEFHADPHRVLREVDRVLVPEGHVVILGFNPWSIWGAFRSVLRFKKEVPWCCASISPFRMKDWLSLLGFDTEHVHTFFFKPPIGNRKFLAKLSLFDRVGERAWPAFGSVYLFVARKRVSTLTPIRPRWRAKKRVLNPGLVETRNEH
ncbi:MAG: methyltransferase domain-containing protein [Gammaproteobacteria bacterium]|nr:methyltransferase domain-containing protein [Gammaproteobacteria bacterium]